MEKARKSRFGQRNAITVPIPRVVKYPLPGSRDQASPSSSWVNPACNSMAPTVRVVCKAVGLPSIKSKSRLVSWSIMIFSSFSIRPLAKIIIV